MEMINILHFTRSLAKISAALIESLGILSITIFLLYGLYMLIPLSRNKIDYKTSIMKSRQFIGSGILLGIELLMAADIIHTVAVDLNFQTIGVLASIVLIRTFLSFTLDLDITGRWPWQQ